MAAIISRAEIARIELLPSRRSLARKPRWPVLQPYNPLHGGLRSRNDIPVLWGRWRGWSQRRVFLSLLLCSETSASEWSEARKVVALTTVAPFLAFFWLIAAFVLHVSISNKIAHQDCGFGLSPDPWVTLPNGYKLGSHNTYDGYISAPGVETAQPVIGAGYVRSIINLKWKDPYFIGTQFDFNTGHQRAFVHDTRTSTTTTSGTKS